MMNGGFVIRSSAVQLRGAAKLEPDWRCGGREKAARYKVAFGRRGFLGREGKGIKRRAREKENAPGKGHDGGVKPSKSMSYVN
jgi:hypothetical protein